MSLVHHVPSPEMGSAGAEQVRVLVVEDSEDYALLVASTLDRSSLADFDVERVTSLDEALASAERSHYDAMLLDLSLPDGCGAFTVAFGCAIADRLPIVVLTSTDDEELAMTAIHAGAQDYLVKDRVDCREVPSAVLRAIERRRRLMALGAQDAVSGGVALAGPGAGTATDPVTGVPARGAFTERISDAIARAQRSGELIGVFVVGLDHFDVLHDMLGKVTFNELVCAVAQRIASSTRRGNAFARLGRETFGVLLECVPSEGSAARAAASLCDALESVSIATPSGIELRTVSSSIGIAFHPDDGDDAEALIARATEAQVQASASDGSSVRLYAPPSVE